MESTFALALGDYQAYMRYLTRTRLRRQVIARVVLMVLVLALLPYAATIAVTGSTRVLPPVLARIWPYFLVAVAFVVVFPFVGAPEVAARRMWSVDPGKVRLRVDESGLVLSEKAVETRFAWEAFKDAHQGPNHLFLARADGKMASRALLVPLRVLAPEQLETILRNVKGPKAGGKGEEAAKSG